MYLLKLCDNDNNYELLLQIRIQGVQKSAEKRSDLHCNDNPENKHGTINSPDKRCPYSYYIRTLSNNNLSPSAKNRGQSPSTPRP